MHINMEYLFENGILQIFHRENDSNKNFFIFKYFIVIRFFEKKNTLKSFLSYFITFIMNFLNECTKFFKLNLASPPRTF